jgi:hypothetical protein
MSRLFRTILASTLLAGCLLLSRVSSAQERNDAWGGITTATAATALAASVLMPRVFYASPEASVGWKARWHVSVLAPSMAQLSLAMMNELVLKDAFKEPRPGCDATGPGLANCESFALFSTQSYLSGAALGQGVAIFLVDTVKYSGSRFNFGGFAGNVLLPLVLAGVTVPGRAAGKFETFGQSMASAGVGLGTGLIFGLIYSTMQAPECGYSGSVLCW